MSPILKILTHILTLYMIPLISSDSSQHWITGPPRIPKPETRLSYPLITDEEKIYTCLEKTILVFNNNGSIINRIPLNHTCNPGMTPVLGASRKIYMIAENRVLKINTMKIRANESAWEVFLGPETGVQGLNKIIGLAVSISSSYVIVAIERRGLFGYRYDGRLKWSIGPAVNPTGYRQGCRRGFIGCFFISVPVIDLCDANIYVANNQGEVYSVSIRTRRFKWIQDLSWLDRNFTITAGNNGLLYATVPERSIIVALDVLTGSVKWQKVIGPLSTQDSAPVADNRGWISMGSLDGFLYSISPSGVVRKFFHRKNLDTVVQQAVLDCSGYAVYMSQTKFDRKISRANDENTYVSAMTPLKTVVTLLVPSTGSVIWFESYPSGSVVSSLFPDSDLRRFVVDERMLLAFLSISNTGNRLSCFSTRQKLASSCSLMDIKKVSIYTGNEKAIKLFLFYETILLILLAALVQFCCVFWRKKKLRNQNLRNFLEKRSSLRLQKKVCDRTITELEKKTAEGSSTNEMLEKLGDLVKEREVITRKLSTTYSLGRDATSPKSLSLIPLSDDKKTKSFSPKSGQKESATIFHTISDASSEDYSSIDEKTESKGKALMEPESASDGDDDGEHEAIVEAQGVKIDDEGDDLQTGGTSMRKRSISLTRNVGSST